jgi:hypothetical protein
VLQASFITPYSSVATFIVLVFILPTVYAILGSRLHLRPVVRDVVVARGSLIFLVLGCLAIAMSPTLEFLIAGALQPPLHSPLLLLQFHNASPTASATPPLKYPHRFGCPFLWQRLLVCCTLAHHLLRPRRPGFSPLRPNRNDRNRWRLALRPRHLKSLWVGPGLRRSLERDGFYRHGGSGSGFWDTDMAYPLAETRGRRPWLDLGLSLLGKYLMASRSVLVRSWIV